MAALDPILDLYRRSFPLSERRDDAAIAASFASPNYRFITAESDGQLTGFAMLFAPDDDFALLEYLAVEPAYRGQGIGGRLVGDCFAAVPNRTVLLEVESATLNVEAARRQQFYQRCGCNRIDGFNYLLPLPNNPPPMELMAFRFKLTDASHLPRWLSRIYRDVYQQAPDDPRLVQMISNLRA